MLLSSLAVLSERVRISSATTAKPFPASPARAASIEAFNDKRLVCSDISSITEIISPTLSTISFTLVICSDISLMPESGASFRSLHGCFPERMMSDF